METHILPHDKDMERLVLGTIMTERGKLDEVRDLLSVDVFYDPFHQDIYKAILAVDKRGDRPDMLIVTQEMRKIHGDNFNAYNVTKVAMCCTFDLYLYARVLLDKARRRKLVEIIHYLTENCYGELIDVEEVISEAGKMLENLLIHSQSSISTMEQAIEGVYKQIDINMSSQKQLTGDPTGFSRFDEKSGGLQKSDLVVIAAETSMGKTSLAINMVMNSAAKVAFYSMEMKKEQVAARMISIHSGVPANEILYSNLADYKLIAVDKGVSRVAKLPVYFDDRSTSNIDTILTSIRTMKLKYNIDGAVIDYLQILNINIKGSNKEQQMGEAARRLKNLAKELDIWIIALSQLNRDTSNNVPTLNRLRDSGQIAEAADIVMLIYRPEVYGKVYPAPFTGAATKGTAMIDVAKGRNIGLIKMLVDFETSTTKFSERNHVPPPITNDEEEEPF